MTSFRTLCTPVVVLLIAAACGSQTRPESSANQVEREDIKQAESAVLTSLAIATSSKGASLCTDQPLSCIGPEKIELAMSLIAARNSPDSVRSLASLVRYQLDGAYSENYHELVIRKGKAIEPVLSSLSPDKLHDQCEREFAELMSSDGSSIGDLKKSYVCRAPKDIESDIKSTLDAIRHHGQPQ